MKKLQVLVVLLSGFIALHSQASCVINQGEKDIGARLNCGGDFDECRKSVDRMKPGDQFCYPGKGGTVSAWDPDNPFGLKCSTSTGAHQMVSVKLDGNTMNCTAGE